MSSCWIVFELLGSSVCCGLTLSLLTLPDVQARPCDQGDVAVHDLQSTLVGVALRIILTQSTLVITAAIQRINCKHLRVRLSDKTSTQLYTAAVHQYSCT